MEYSGADYFFDHPPEWVKAVNERKDDWQVRLVYADWLDDNGYHQRASEQRRIAECMRNNWALVFSRKDLLLIN